MKYLKIILALIRDQIYDHYINYKYSFLTKKNQNLKNMGKGKRVFLLATGPSIKKENLKILKGEDCFSVSNFFLHQDVNLLKPKFHFFAPYHKPLILENYIDWLRKADNELPKGTKIFLASQNKELSEKYNLFSDREIFYLTLSPIMRKKIDITKTILSSQTGTLMILPILLYMGYSDIYLLGCDHNILKDYGRTTKNFYSPQKDVRKNATNNKSWDHGIIWSHQSSLNVFFQYQKYKKKLKNQKITNLSSESWLEEFPKKTLAEII